MSAIKFRRNYAWLLFFCMHGLIVAVVGVGFFVFGLDRTFSPVSEQNRFRRLPSEAERANGERWFSGTVTSLAAAPNEGTRPAKDPWGGCAIHRERYVSGKNGGWRFDYAWSNGTLVATEGPGNYGTPQVAEVELYRVVPDTSFDLAFPEVRKYLPNESPHENYRYKMNCVRVGDAITIDGQIDSSGFLRGIGGRIGAIIETRARLRERLLDDAIFSSLSLMGIGLTFAWLASLTAFALQWLAFTNAVRPAVGGVARSALLPGVAAVVGLTLGFALFMSHIPNVAVILVYLVAFGLGGLAWKVLREAASPLARMKRLLAGETLDGVTSLSGKIQEDAPRVNGRLIRGAHAFTFFEIFKAGAKGAIAERIGTFPSTEEIVAITDGGRFTFPTADATYACEFSEIRMTAAAFANINPDIRRFGDALYWVRESVIDQAGALTIFGVAKQTGDRMADADAYRSMGPLHVFEGNPLVFGHSPAVVKKRVARDLILHRFFVALLVLWSLTVVASVVLISIAGLLS